MPAKQSVTLPKPAEVCALLTQMMQEVEQMKGQGLTKDNFSSDIQRRIQKLPYETKIHMLKAFIQVNAACGRTTYWYGESV